jgi:hypothetical protein
MLTPRAVCEFPAGLAAVSLRLHGGRHCRPPISRMGNKQGYAEVILDALGLRSGQGAGAYLWAEADPDVRALLRAYPDAAMLTRIAEIIRGWADEEPRALWERLRAERKARGPAVEPDEGGGVDRGITAHLAWQRPTGGGAADTTVEPMLIPRATSPRHAITTDAAAAAAPPSPPTPRSPHPTA